MAEPDLGNSMAATVRQPLPPEFTLPAAPDKPGLLDQMLPKVYTPEQQREQEIAKQAFGFVPGSAAVDMYDAVQNQSPVGMGLAALGMIPGFKGARTAVKTAVNIGEDLVKPIRAFHSSPHNFDQFRDVGRTGEGARAITDGAYFAESPKVSGQGGQYWDKFAGKIGWEDNWLARDLKAVNFDRNALIANNEKWIDALIARRPEYESSGTMDDFNKNLASLQNRLDISRDPTKHIGPYTYEVNIHANPNDMLQWDKPLTAQPQLWDRIDPKVKSAIDDALDYRGMNAMSDAPEAYTGRELFKSLRHEDVHESLPDVLPGSSWLTGDTTQAKHATAYLESLGVPGTKYLDAGSRGKMGHSVFSSDLYPGEWLFKGRRYHDPEQLARDVKAAEADFDARRTYNYVVHPNSLDMVEIAKKYAAPGILGTGLASSVLSQQKPVQTQ